VNTRFLPKPYQTDAVAQLIRRTLDGQGGRSPAAHARSAIGGGLDPARSHMAPVIPHSAAAVSGPRTVGTPVV
jgi:hypothetical protein